MAEISPIDIMELMSAIRKTKPTLAVEFLFGLYFHVFFPKFGIISVSVLGTVVVETDIDGSRFIARFIDNQRIEGAIPVLVDTALRFAHKNISKKT